MPSRLNPRDKAEAAQAIADFRFYEELNDFLRPALRKRTFSQTFNGAPAVKDVIEAIGVPHAEVDLVLIDGESVNFARRLRDGNRVAVYDFLVFDRPMFFLNQTAGTIGDACDSRLFRCGTRIDPDCYTDIYPTIERALAGDAAYSAARAELYRYTHAERTGDGALRAEIAAACAGSAPAWLRGAA